ncbi:hypothetical protein LTR08_008665 [Meristemomyces frigidus]|nr:hypothetical protein LTR08_008665 [Meristemomyces frigidus]
MELGSNLSEMTISDGYDDNHSVNGDEGAAEHKIEVGDFGYVSPKDIYTALAKRDRCTCHGGILPEGENYRSTAFNSLETSGFLPTDSMLIEHKESPSAALSASVESLLSGTGSDAYLGMGGHLTLPAPMSSVFQTCQGWSSHGRAYFSSVEVGMSSGTHYPAEINIGDIAGSADHSEYNL